MLTAAEQKQTIESIADLQLDNGMIEWFPGGHSDPWNHVEAAMALAIGGYRDQADAAYKWLAGIQHDDGSWCSYYLAGDVDRGPAPRHQRVALRRDRPVASLAHLRRRSHSSPRCSR